MRSRAFSTFSLDSGSQAVQHTEAFPYIPGYSFIKIALEYFLNPRAAGLLKGIPGERQ